MATKLERLEFAVGLRDNASGKLGKLRGALNRLTETATRQVETAAAGAAGVAGAGYSIHKMVAPAIDLNRALGEVASLDVDQGALKVLQTQAEGFAMSYGGSAADVVRASYDIQSAIAGLTGQELGRFTVASGVLAKATKADVGTITSYMGTMYGIFQRTADDMGKASWVEQIAGQTAAAVKMFKTTGSEMSAGFTSLGANATAAGRGAAEQMAVLGKLQATMSGSEAGTKYKAFLAGVGGAQDKLGLQLTDSQGNMLGMVEILDRLRGKFGDTLDVAEGDQLKDAFGSDEAVSLINLLLADTQGLAANIAAIGKIDGLGPATTMAARMTDVWARLGGTVGVLAAAFGQTLLPPLEGLVDTGVAVLQTVVGWIKTSPDLARWVGFTAVTVMALAGATSLLSVTTAISKLAMLGLGGPLKPLILLYKLLNTETRAAMFAQWKLNLAFLANPMTWVVIGVVALIAAVAALIYYWDDLKKAFLDSSWGKTIMQVIEALLHPLRTLGDTWDWLKGKLGLGGTATVAVQGSTAPPKPVAATAMGLGQPIMPPAPPAMLEPARTSAAPSGGLLRETTNQINRGNSKQTTIGTVNINTTNPTTPAQMGEMWALQAG